MSPFDMFTVHARVRGACDVPRAGDGQNPAQGVARDLCRRRSHTVMRPFLSPPACFDTACQQIQAQYRATQPLYRESRLSPP